MKRIFQKEQILTIPNILSLVRLLLIPAIVLLYCVKHLYAEAVALIIFSGFTDIADGIIARRFGMVSDFGKILDPIADKLTQITVIFCIATRVNAMWLLVGMFIIKEIVMLYMGMIAIKKLDAVSSAKWYGKANTVILYIAMISFILFPEMNNTLVYAVVAVTAVSLVISLALYVRFYYMLFKRNEKDTQTVTQL